MEIESTSNPAHSESTGIDGSSYADSRNSRGRLESFESDLHKASMASCFMNLANTILGSGMLGLPYAYSHTGWVLGSFLLLICGCSSAFALHLLALCALEMKGPASFYTVAQATMPSFTVVIDVAVAIKCFGVATSYLIVIGDLMPQVMSQFGAAQWAQDRHIWVFIGFCVVAPLCCLRNLDSLRFTSTASLGFVVFLTLLVVLFASNVPSLDPCQSVADDDVCVGRTANAIVDMTTGKVISIFIFGYTCQQNIFSSVNEMKQPTPGRINAVVATSIFVAMSIYLIVAACGYHTYGASVDPDILVNYPETSFVSVARLAVSLLVAFSYPLQCHPSRRSILTLLSTYLDKPAEDKWLVAAPTSSPLGNEELGSPTGDHSAEAEISQFNSVSVASSAVAPSIETQAMRYTVVTACFLGLSLLIGLTVTNLGTVLALVGATGSTTVSYILPGFFYFFLFENKGPAWKRYLALAQGIIGLIIVPVCLTFIFL